MIITREEAYAAIYDGRATTEGTVIAHGQRYTVLTRHDEQRTDHVLESGGLDMFGAPVETLHDVADAIRAKAGR